MISLTCVARDDPIKSQPSRLRAAVRRLDVVATVQSEDRGTLRPVAEQNAAYVFGGAKPGAADVAPRIMDLITPDGVSQSAALSYSAGQRATLPFRSL
nr:glucodextranase DOMON-like domain-containing protein [Halococcus agarilyticus]